LVSRKGAESQNSSGQNQRKNAKEKRVARRGRSYGCFGRFGSFRASATDYNLAMPIRRLWTIGCFGLIIAVGAVLFVSAQNVSLVDMYQVAESDGHRQLEYKILGFIPYERQVDSPEVNVTEDFWREYKRTGVKLPTKLESALRDAKPIRITGRGNRAYAVNASVTGDHAKLASELSLQFGNRPTDRRSWQYSKIDPATSRYVSIYLFLSRKGSPNGGDESHLHVQFSVPK